MRPMDHPLTPRDALIRPWRRATVLATAVAAAELLAIVTLISILLTRGGDSTSARAVEPAPAAPAAARTATKAVATPTKRGAVASATKLKVAPAAKPATHAKKKPAAAAMLSRSSTAVTVLNGSGRSGVAHSAASGLQNKGYRISYVGNAPHFGFAASVVMYRPGFKREAQRTAHDLGVGRVSPLDGLRAADLRGAKLAVVLGG